MRSTSALSAGSPDPIRAVDKGAPTVILRIDSLASPYSIVSKADIKSPADLERPHHLARRAERHHAAPISIAS